jgi:hypothetical protein
MNSFTVRSAVAAALVGLLPALASAQPWVTYDAALGTFPQAQCFAQNLDTNPALVPTVLEVADGDLHVSTLGWPAGGDIGGGIWWDRSDVPITFASGAALELRMRVVSAPDRSINPASGWPRPGLAMYVSDSTGRIYWVGFGSGRVFLSNSVFGAYDSPNTLDIAFNTTDAHHVYRIEAGPSGAVLLIDGVQRIGPIGPGAPGSPSATGVAYFGDLTYWANGEAYISSFRITGIAQEGFSGLSGPDSTRTCPLGSAQFHVDAQGAEPLQYRWQAEFPSQSGTWLDLDDGPSKHFGTVAGSSTPTLSLTGVGPAAATAYRAVITSTCGEITTVPATLRICRADFNCDGIVNSTDVSEFINQWFTDQVEGTFITDIDANGVVNSTDVSEFINWWFDDVVGGCG